MGQLIAFPTPTRQPPADSGPRQRTRIDAAPVERERPRPPANARSDSPSDAAWRRRSRPRPSVAILDGLDRPRVAALELLYGLTYALGLFLAAPVLVLVAFDGVFAGEPLTSLGALVLLALVLPLAAAARKRV